MANPKIQYPQNLMEAHAHDLHKVPAQEWRHYFFEFIEKKID